MRSTKFFFVFVAVVAVFELLGQAANASVLIAEDMTGYAEGNLVPNNGGAGFSGAWAGSAAFKVANAAGMSYLDYLGGGGAPGSTVNSADVTYYSTAMVDRKATPVQASATGYFASLQKFSAVTAASRVCDATLKVVDSTDKIVGVVNVGNGYYTDNGNGSHVPGRWGLTVIDYNQVAAYLDSGVSITPGTTHLAVAAVDWNDAENGLDRIRLYIDPVLSLGQAGNTPAIDTSAYDVGMSNQVNAMQMDMQNYSSAAASTYSVDGLRYANTWAAGGLTSVPEPGCLTLLATGLLGLLAYAWRKRR